MTEATLLCLSVISFLFAFIIFLEWDDLTDHPFFFFMTSLGTGGIFLGMFLHG